MKEKTVWFCSNCGNEYPKWMGRCPACGEWNTMVEQKVVTGGSRKAPVTDSVPGSGHRPQKLNEIDSSSEARISLNNGEIDRILGGGVVEGSLVLIGGEPGIGKSTLSLQIPLGCPSLKTLYVTGEESLRQVKMRADRLGGGVQLPDLQRDADRERHRRGPGAQSRPDDRGFRADDVLRGR